MYGGFLKRKRNFGVANRIDKILKNQQIEEICGGACMGKALLKLPKPFALLQNQPFYFFFFFLKISTFIYLGGSQSILANQPHFSGDGI